MCHRLLQLLLQEEAEDRDTVMVEGGRVQDRRRKKRFEVKPWLRRRHLFGQYETLFQELDQQSAGDI
jgi:hypothetical protein